MRVLGVSRKHTLSISNPPRMYWKWRSGILKWRTTPMIGGISAAAEGVEVVIEVIDVDEGCGNVFHFNNS